MFLTAICLSFLLPASAACLYYFGPLVLSLWPRRRNRPAFPGQELHTIAILIPAHDEEETLPRALRSVQSLDYQADRVRIHVVADNCSDGTAAIARAAGVRCLVRSDEEHKGKGHAIAFGLAEVLKEEPDFVLMLDADCELNLEALRELDAAFATGVDAVQSAVRFANADAGASGYVAAVGAAIDDRVAEARDRLGGSAPLRGMGMAFRRSILDRVPWDAFGIVEDAEYGDSLRAAGVRVRFCAGAVVTTWAPERPADLYRQRKRWQAALRLSRCVESKPLVLLHLAATTLVCLLAGSFMAWAAVLLVLSAFVYVRGMIDVGLTWKKVTLLARAPAVILRLGWVTIQGRVRCHPAEWNRTPRSVAQRLEPVTAPLPRR